MQSKIVMAVVVILAVALVAGTGYILFRPQSVATHGDRAGRSVSAAGDLGQSAAEETLRGEGGLGNGENVSVPLETVRGEVISSASEIVVRTADGEEILVGLGQAWYREQAGFTVAVGDEVVIVGFYEEGEFKAVSAENVTTGERLALRDTSGRPAWAGEGNRRNNQP